MSTCNTDLGRLIVGSMRGFVKRGCAARRRTATVPALLVGSLYKCAGPAIVSDQILSKDEVARLNKFDRDKAEAANRARTAREAGKVGLTGDKEYDNLPDVVARRQKYQQAYAEYAKNHPGIVKRMTPAEIMKAVDAEGPVTSWGDNWLGKGLGTAIAIPFKSVADIIGSNVSYLTSAPKGTSYSDWMKTYYDTATQGGVLNSFADVGHDVANNFQLQANSLGHGAAQLTRLAGEYLDPSSYGNSVTAKNRRMSYQNTRANADKMFLERQNRIVNNFEDSTLRDVDKPGNWLGMLNYGGNTAVGQFAGEALVTAGAGTAAKGVGSGINHGTRALAGAVRGAGAAAGAGRGARLVAGARNTLAKGVEAVGETVEMPFKTVGTALADPIGSGDKFIRKGIPNVYKGVKQTVGTGVGRPLKFLRHPIVNTQRAIIHPWQATKGVFHWGKDTLTPAARVAFSKPAWQAQTWYDAVGDASNGNYGSAAGRFGSMGVYGMGNRIALPYMIMQGMYGGGDDQGYQGAQVY